MTRHELETQIESLEKILKQHGDGLVDLPQQEVDGLRCDLKALQEKLEQLNELDGVWPV